MLRYERVVDERTYQVLAHIAGGARRLPLPGGARPLLSSRHSTAIGDHARELVLRGPEAVVLEL